MARLLKVLLRRLLVIDKKKTPKEEKSKAAFFMWLAGWMFTNGITNWALLNSIMLEYKNKPFEVIFGWLADFAIWPLHLGMFLSEYLP